MSWLVAAVAAYFAITFVNGTISKGKARALREKARRRAVSIPAPEPVEEAPPKSAHEVLGVARGASRAEINAAYRKLAAQYHPDKLSTSAPEIQELAARRLREINAAYGELRARTPRDD